MFEGGKNTECMLGMDVVGRGMFSEGTSVDSCMFGEFLHRLGKRMDIFFVVVEAKRSCPSSNDVWTHGPNIRAAQVQVTTRVENCWCRAECSRCQDWHGSSCVQHEERDGDRSSSHGRYCTAEQMFSYSQNLSAASLRVAAGL